MNKKYLNIILIILLCFIWGSVIYKYFIKNESLKEQHQEVINLNANYNYVVIKDTFKLNINNKDPFKVSKNKFYSKIVKPLEKKALKKSTKSNTLWPNISYYGFVRGEKNKTKLALIEVNNRLYRKRENEKIEDLYLLKAYGDSVIVSLNNNTKTIKTINE